MKDQVPQCLINEVLICMQQNPQMWVVNDNINIWSNEADDYIACRSAKYTFNGREINIYKPLHLFSKCRLNGHLISKSTFTKLMRTLNEARTQLLLKSNDNELEDIYTRLRELNGTRNRPLS